MGGPAIARIFSGGQTGVDRAALDAAIAHNLPYGGWCPAGGWAEDACVSPGVLVPYPQLQETDSSDPDVRTRFNVRDSHATLMVTTRFIDSPGTEFTLMITRRLHRPVLVEADDPARVLGWLASLGRDLTVNIAGPRESEQPGVYALALDFVSSVIEFDRNSPASPDCARHLRVHGRQ